MRETIHITQEIIGVYFIPNYSPDYEGISFYLEDGSFARIGMDESYTPNLSDYIMLPSRLIGFASKFYTSSRTSLPCPGFLSLVTDDTSCEEGIFTAPNPFTTLTADVFTGSTVS